MGKIINKLYLISSFLVLATALSFLVLTNSTVSADVVDDVSISVPVSCSITSSLDSAHSATINPGQYLEDIGTTTFKVFCNDNTGYALYAIGYSNEEYGNTNLLPTNTSNPNIVTGLATSGDTSNWAMKLTPVTEQSSGTSQPYVPTIENGFNSYGLVPETYTKVATFTSTTDFTIGSSLQSTHRAYIGPLQPADTYEGKVRYTLVHPNDAAPPEPEIPASQTAELDVGSVVNEKFGAFGVYNVEQVATLPDDFVPTAENTISSASSPNPIYIVAGESIYTDAIKIYLNSDSAGLFQFTEGWVCLTNLDASRMTDASYMFMGTSGVSCPDEMLSHWDVSSVTNMKGMFAGNENAGTTAAHQDTISAISRWDVSNVTNMQYMFAANSPYDYADITDLSPLADWNVSNVTNMAGIFYNSQADDGTVLNGWNVSNVTDMYEAFRGIPQDKWPSWCDETCGGY